MKYSGQIILILLSFGFNFNLNANENIIYATKIDSFKHLNDHLGKFYGLVDGKYRIRGFNNIDSNGNVLYSNKEGSAWVGTYVKNKNVYWKGYYKHTYKDGNILYQYIEYDNGGNYKTIKSNLITKEEFDLVLKYIFLDTDLPFDFSKKYLISKKSAIFKTILSK